VRVAELERQLGLNSGSSGKLPSSDGLKKPARFSSLRELKALVEIEREDGGRKMQTLLRRTCHTTNLAREQGVQLPPGFIALVQRRYDAILVQCFAFHEAQPALVRASGKAKGHRGRTPRRVGHNLLLRLSTRKHDVLRFLSNPAVPFTNTLAERDAQMMKLRQKVSGGVRCERGATDFGIIRSVLSTARKQGWDLLRTLTATPHYLIAHLRVT